MTTGVPKPRKQSASFDPRRRRMYLCSHPEAFSAKGQKAAAPRNPFGRRDVFQFVQQVADASHAQEAHSVRIGPGANIAVTGATGFIGGRLVEILTARGAGVTCLLRGNSGPCVERTGAKMLKLNVEDQDDLNEVLNNIDVVFHCAYDRENTDWNFKALRALISWCRVDYKRRLVH